VDKKKEKQDIQEEEYQFPYHWTLRKESRKGVVYYGYYNLALAAAGPLAGKRVLDAGCGDGYFTRLIKKQGAEQVVGTDYSARALSFARLLAPGIDFTEADLMQLPYEDVSFDVVFLVEVLEHIPSDGQKHIVRELARILKPGGLCIITVPSVRMPVIEKHEEHFTKESLARLLEVYFSVKNTEGQDRGDWVADLFWIFWRLWDNRFWRIKPLVGIVLPAIYMRFMNAVSAETGRRLVGTFQKK